MVNQSALVSTALKTTISQLYGLKHVVDSFSHRGMGRIVGLLSGILQSGVGKLRDRRSWPQSMRSELGIRFSGFMRIRRIGALKLVSGHSRLDKNAF